ncbi:MAG: transporter substrate-binding domain-containing protein [Chloroflexi bacterium]|nr:transporter substrate-binding domain-containing protein [Chloroflexota bacterium]
MLIAVSCAGQSVAPAQSGTAQPAAATTQPAAPAAKPAASATIRIGSLPHVESWADALLVAKVLESAYPYLKVELTGFDSGNPIVSGLQTGQLDAGVIVGEQPAVNGIAAKSAFKIVTSYGWAQKHHGYVIPVNSSIKTLDDLKGKTVAVQLGTSQHEFAGTILKEKSSLTLGDLNIVNMPAPQGAVALQAGQIDAAVLDSGPMQKVIGDGTARLLQDGTGTNWASTFGTVLSDKFIKEHPTEARRLVEAFRLEQEFQQDHAVLVAELYSQDKRVNLAFEPALKAITAFPRYPDITDPATVGVYQRVADFLLAQKQLKEKLDIAASGYINPSFYDEAQKRLGKFPYPRGREMKVDLSEKGKSLDDALAPYIERLKKADPQ